MENLENITENPNPDAIYNGDISDAIEDCYREKEQVLNIIAGRPSTTEVASWGSKVAAAGGVKTSGGPTPIILAKDLKKYGSPHKAVAIILARSRLFELAKTVADTMFDGVKTKLPNAINQTELQEIQSNFSAALESRQTQFQDIRDAVKSGDLSKLDAGERDLLAQAR